MWTTRTVSSGVVNIYIFQELKLQPKKTEVWCPISWCVVRPLFFEDKVDGNIYWDIITKFILLLEEYEQNCWFQQDGTTCQTSNKAMSTLKDFWWSSCFNFYLWSYLKGVIHGNENPHTLEEYESSKITFQMLREVSANTMRRVCTCIQAQGKHFQHLL
jgi:hypothetical protein